MHAEQKAEQDQELEPNLRVFAQLRISIFSLRSSHDRVHAGRDPAFVIPPAKMRCDNLADDLARQGVCQHTFQSVTDFNADLSVIFEDEEDHAVIAALLPRLPRLGKTHGKILERFPLKRLESNNGDLV